MDTKELVFKTMKSSGKALKSAEIAALAKIDKAEVDKALKALRKEEKIVSPKNCYYSAK